MFESLDTLRTESALARKLKVLKEPVRILSKVIGGFAVLVFFFAPLTHTGLALMGGSIIVGLICMAGYMWSERDRDPSSSEDPS
jgi:hypothetical protein